MPPYPDPAVVGGTPSSSQAASAFDPFELVAAAMSTTWLMAALVLVVVAYLLLTLPRR